MGRKKQGEDPVRSQVCVQLPLELYRALEVYCAETGLSKTETVQDALIKVITEFEATICPRCNVRNIAHARFCSGCGLPFDQEAREEMAELERLMKKYPDVLLSTINSQKD